MTEFDVARENFQKLGLIYPAVEWRITMTGKAGAGHLQVSLMMLLVAFVISLYN